VHLSGLGTALPMDPTPIRPEPEQDLARFLKAQDEDGTYARAVDELRAGRKRSHWMWFVFPQVAGLGHSPTARAYALSGLAEARAYLHHPVLGRRLRESCRALLDGTGSSAAGVLGDLDAMKLRSSMTLFARADPGEGLFTEVLDRFYDGRTDPATDDLLP
jgi:uncharacterized protein (DUF1810 family)